MKREAYLSVLSKLSTAMPLFAKAALEIAMKRRGKAVESLSPLDLIQILQEDIGPKLRTLGLNYRSILLAGAAQIQTNEADEVVYLNSPAKRLLSQLIGGDSLKPVEQFIALKEAGFIKSVREIRDMEVRDGYDEKLGRHLNLTLTPIRGFRPGGASAILGVSAVIQDFTLKEEIESELQLSYQKLEKEMATRKQAEEMLIASAKLSAIGEMATGIAHEIRNPLGLIVLKAGMMKRYHQDGVLTSELTLKLAEEITGTAHKINLIIAGVLAMAHEGSTDPFVRVSVKKIFDDALSFCAERMHHQQIRMIRTAVSDDLTVEARPTEIAQIILNLINNAVDAIEPLPEKWIQVSAEDRGERVEISVMDSGNGIPPEIADKIMKPFFTTKPASGGTGLGLSISRRIADSHRGSFALDRSSAHTRFVLTLPKTH